MVVFCCETHRKDFPAAAGNGGGHSGKGGTQRLTMETGRETQFLKEEFGTEGQWIHRVSTD